MLAVAHHAEAVRARNRSLFGGPSARSTTSTSGASASRALPVADGSVDLFLSYFGLHCFPDPEAALREAARCLAPGSTLVGGSIVSGPRPLDRLRVRPGVGAFGPVGDASALRRWLVAAGFERVEIDWRGVFAYFRARRPQAAGSAGCARDRSPRPQAASRLSRADPAS